MDNETIFSTDIEIGGDPQWKELRLYKKDTHYYVQVVIDKRWETLSSHSCLIKAAQMYVDVALAFIGNSRYPNIRGYGLDQLLAMADG